MQPNMPRCEKRRKNPGVDEERFGPQIWSQRSCLLWGTFQVCLEKAPERKRSKTVESKKDIKKGSREKIVSQSSSYILEVHNFEHSFMPPVPTQLKSKRMTTIVEKDASLRPPDKEKPNLCNDATAMWCHHGPGPSWMSHRLPIHFQCTGKADVQSLGSSMKAGCRTVQQRSCELSWQWSNPKTISNNNLQLSNINRFCSTSLHSLGFSTVFPASFPRPGTAVAQQWSIPLPQSKLSHKPKLFPLSTMSMSDVRPTRPAFATTTFCTSTTAWCGELSVHVLSCFEVSKSHLQTLWMALKNSSLEATQPNPTQSMPSPLPWKMPATCLSCKILTRDGRWMGDGWKWDLCGPHVVQFCCF